ncbi:MAG: hypothetical protein IRZ28_09850 [Steroidobacteraceae bacterium]|nr:hypothetical protein [Steroidobacteraceae bacterium]
MTSGWGKAPPQAVDSRLTLRVPETWQLDADGQPTQGIIEERRRADFITPIPKPRRRRAEQRELSLADDNGLSSERQQYHSAIINELRTHVDQWRKLPQSASLHSDTSRPFDRPESGRIAVKVINHLGDEVMKVFRV